MNNISSSNDNSSSNAFNMAVLIAGLTAIIFLIKVAESRNRIDYDSRLLRIISGLLNMIANTWHTKSDDIEIADTAGTILALGPHRTGFVDGLVVTSKMTGTPPTFFVTDHFNHIPGLSQLIKLAKAIPIKSDKNASNAVALEQANTILREKGCIVIFPQGNFSKIDKEPPRIYEGAARLAVKNKAPIQVIRLDNYLCIQNWLIPLFIRNSTHYRALLSAFHINNVKVTKCDVIDFHIQNHDQDKEKEIINEICAQLYAYFRHTEDLSTGEIKKIKNEITAGRHFMIWNNKLEQCALEKRLLLAKNEEKNLTEPTSIKTRITNMQ